MRTHIIIASALVVLAGGFGGRAEAGDTRYLVDSGSYRHEGPRTVYVSVGVPLLFYTSRENTSSIYGSPDDGISNVPKYFGSSAYSAKYYRYRSSLWYTDKVYARCAVVGSPTTAEVQRELAQRGYYRGAIDGVLGPMSRSAIGHYQLTNGLRATGAIDDRLLRALGMMR